MSRTTRRNKAWLIREAVGTLDEAKRDGAWWLHYRTSHDLTVEQAHARRVHRYTSDAGWCWSVPSWFTRATCNVPERRFSKRQLHRGIRRDEWDDHLVHMNYRRPYWW